MPPVRTAAAFACIALAACATPSAPTAADWRVLVKLAQPATDGEAIARRASAVGGVPMRYVAPTSPEWHALSLRCADAAECDAALARLRADPGSFAAVERDQRRQPHTP